MPVLAHGVVHGAVVAALQRQYEAPVRDGARRRGRLLCIRAAVAVHRCLELVVQAGERGTALLTQLLPRLEQGRWAAGRVRLFPVVPVRRHLARGQQPRPHLLRLALQHHRAAPRVAALPVLQQVDHRVGVVHRVRRQALRQEPQQGPRVHAALKALHRGREPPRAEVGPPRGDLDLRAPGGRVLACHQGRGVTRGEVRQAAAGLPQPTVLQQRRQEVRRGGDVERP
ncbi:hypothetical protein STCU_12238 [Strigomonas culicis]|uniref:Uncharacterized protein n=1 Tax=Strigomonas culicis TaxID=28005 RepID=S9UKN6_9TRYP|nr:hypothetical protein STCU_12238 [Strigomonas culicis]|eukprot:EPY15216.1 hypothetical protein STCU_12238 [Strigomonas culicis]